MIKAGLHLTFAVRHLLLVIVSVFFAARDFVLSHALRRGWLVWTGDLGSRGCIVLNDLVANRFIMDRAWWSICHAEGSLPATMLVSA